ncbi:MAG: hypothetical protein ACYDIC_07840 [Desulfobaccales bacterium]
MSIFSFLKEKIPFELKRGTSIFSIILALILAGICTKAGELILMFLVKGIKPFLPSFWYFLISFLTIKFEVNLFGIIIFTILLFPVYRWFDKIFLRSLKGVVIFRDKFDSGNQGWSLNFWGSKNPDKTNRIEKSMLIFEATEDELNNENKEYGAYFDLKNGVYKGNRYEIACKVRADENTTMQFRLWLHDTRGRSNCATSFLVPSKKSEKIKLEFTANETEAIRIHLHCKAGTGRIIVEEVLVKKI